MPKQKITKEMIVDAAFSIARTRGSDHVLVKNIAEELNCSVQPIYSYCENMEGLRQELIKKTASFFKQYIAEHIDKSNYFRGVGNAYISLAKEEPHLYRLYFMRIRKDIHSLNDIYEKECNPQVAAYIAESLHISPQKARAFHMNMLIYTQGIALILASSGSDINAEEISAQLEQAYLAFEKQALQP